MDSRSVEAAEFIPKFASSKEEIYVRLGCEVCQNAVQIRTAGFPMEEIEKAVEDVPYLRVGNSYRVIKASEDCGDGSDCQFGLQISQIQASLIAETAE